MRRGEGGSAHSVSVHRPAGQWNGFLPPPRRSVHKPVPVSNPVGPSADLLWFDLVPHHYQAAWLQPWTCVYLDPSLQQSAPLDELGRGGSPPCQLDQWKCEVWSASVELARPGVSVNELGQTESRQVESEVGLNDC